MFSHRIAPALLTVLLPAALVTACSGADGAATSAGDSADVAFHGELRPFDGLDLSSGMQPPASPVQVALSFAVDGAVTVDAKAVSGGPADAPRVAGTPGSGKQEIKARLKADAKVKVDLSALQYDGPLPGIEALDVAFAGASTFDPFLLDGSSLATADVPETRLPPIPLPGGIPGSIVLTIEKGSFVRSSFHGTCANVTTGASPTAHYVGATKLDGELLVRGTVEIKAPLSKKIEIPSFKVKIPARDLAVDLGEVGVTGGEEIAGTSLMTSDEACSATPAPTAPPSAGSKPAPPPDPTTDPTTTPPVSCTAPNTCASAQSIGTIAGDGTAVAAPLTASGTTGRWLSFRVKETDSGVFGKSLKVKATLTAPQGWTFTARMDTQTDVAQACSAKLYTPIGNALALEWTEGFGASDDSRNVVVEIKPGTCPITAPWTFKVERN